MIPALAELAEMIGDPQVRARGTIGGSIANNDPAADYPAAVLGLNATVHTNKRQIAGDDFFTGMFETALAEDELVTSVSFPKPEKANYTKFRNPGQPLRDRRRDGGAGPAAACAWPSPAPRPCVFRASDMESALAGNFAAAALDGVTVKPNGLNGDIHASAEYRAHLVKVMAKRAVAGIA